MFGLVFFCKLFFFQTFFFEKTQHWRQTNKQTHTHTPIAPYSKNYVRQFLFFFSYVILLNLRSSDLSGPDLPFSATGGGRSQISVGTHGRIMNGLMHWVICMDDHENSVGANRILWKTQWVPHHENSVGSIMKIQWAPSSSCHHENSVGAIRVFRCIRSNVIM